MSSPLSEASYRPGSDRGSPNDGSTLFSKRVMALIRLPERVRTYRPTPWLMPIGVRRYTPKAGWPFARVGTRSNLRPEAKRLAQKGATTSRDRKSTRLNSSHRTISYAVFCLKKKKKKQEEPSH